MKISLAPTGNHLLQINAKSDYLLDASSREKNLHNELALSIFSSRLCEKLITNVHYTNHLLSLRLCAFTRKIPQPHVKQLLTNHKFIYFKFNVVYRKSFLALRPLPFLFMKNRVLCFGEVLWDAFGDEKKAGGAPMNVARHLVQQHVDVAFASRVGTDASGDELVDFLNKNGLYSSSLIQRDNNLPTCEVTVKLDEQNQATYTIPEPVSWDNIQLDNNLIDGAKRSSTIVFGSLACRDKVTHDTLLNLLDETDALKIFDVNLYAGYY
jgi:hypothetical protein